MPVRKKAYVNTIGCQMNVYDSEKLAAILLAFGYDRTQDMDAADLVLCNTCAIRHKAEEKAFSFLGRFAKEKQKKPHLITIMAGCVAQQEGGNAFDRLPHLNLVLGTQAFSRLGTHLQAIENGKTRIVDTDEAEAIFEALPDTSAFDQTQVSKFVTIMQGCDNYCTYCVVPYVRGREKSRSPESIVTEVQALADAGVREVTLLGQNVNSYGVKDGQISFAELLKQVHGVTNLSRIRFATSHPKDLSDDLIRAMAGLEKVCNHLHLPVQSGSDRILKKMNRGYTRQIYLKRIQSLRAACPDMAVSTDIIVGFPSETESDFNETMALLREVEFDSIFAFAYSDRSSAPAAKFPDQVDEAVKMRRLNELLALQETFTEAKNRAQTGKTLEVLVEGESPKARNGFVRTTEQTRQMFGRTASNKIVHFPSDRARIGDLIRIHIEEAYPHSLWGRPSGSDSQ